MRKSERERNKTFAIAFCEERIADASLNEVDRASWEIRLAVLKSGIGGKDGQQRNERCRTIS
jgi:hypothetical protein